MEHIEKFKDYINSMDESVTIEKFPDNGCVFINNKLELETVSNFLIENGFTDVYSGGHQKSIENYINRIDKLKTTIIAVIWNGKKFYATELSDNQLTHGLADGSILEFSQFMFYTYNWVDVK
jgi:hypothetical protein